MRTQRHTFLAVAFLLVAAALASADEATRNLYRNTLRATVWLRSSTGTGTAWVADRDQRLLITNHHMVLNDDQVEVYFPIYREDGGVVAERSAYSKDRGCPAKVIDADESRDLAILQLIGPLPSGVQEQKLAASSGEAGDRVHSIGNPGASDALWVYTSGAVRAVYHRRWPSRNEATHARYQRSARVVETQSPLNHGDSGGPVVNDQGELVAVVSSGKTTDGQGLVQLMSQCIDVSEVRVVLGNVGRLLEPRSAADFSYRGYRRSLRRRFQEAIADYTEALRRDSNYASAYSGRGWIFGEQGDFDTAIVDYNQYLRLAPGDAIAFTNRGHYFLQKKNETKALADFSRAIQLDPRYALA